MEEKNHRASGLDENVRRTGGGNLADLHKKNRTKVEIVDIAWTTIAEDNPNNPQAIYRMHIIANVAGISTDLPQAAVHTPHTHLTLGWFRVGGNQINTKETLIRNIRLTMPLTLAAELYMK